MPRWSQCALSATYSFLSFESCPRTMPTTFALERCFTLLRAEKSMVMPVLTGLKSRDSASLRSFAMSSPAGLSSAVAALSVIQPRMPSGGVPDASRGSIRCSPLHEPTTVCQG